MTSRSVHAAVVIFEGKTANSIGEHGRVTCGETEQGRSQSVAMLCSSKISRDRQTYNPRTTNKREKVPMLEIQIVFSFWAEF